MLAVVVLVLLLFVIAAVVKYWFVVLPVAVAAVVARVINAQVKSKRAQEAKALAARQAELAAGQAEKARIAAEAISGNRRGFCRVDSPWLRRIFLRCHVRCGFHALAPETTSTGGLPAR